METSTAPAEEYLCQAFSDKRNFCSEWCGCRKTERIQTFSVICKRYLCLSKTTWGRASSQTKIPNGSWSHWKHESHPDWLVSASSNEIQVTAGDHVHDCFHNWIGSCRITSLRRCCSWWESLPCLLQANMRKCTLQKSVDFAFVTDNTYTKFQIRQMEMAD